MRGVDKTRPQTAAIESPPSSIRSAIRKAYRSCVGLLRLVKCHDDARLDCRRTGAGHRQLQLLRSVDSILEHRLEGAAAEPLERADRVEHDNIPRRPLLPLSAERNAQTLTHPTVQKLQQLRPAGMAKALTEQLDAPEIDALPTGCGAPDSGTTRASRTSTSGTAAGLDKELVLSFADGRWVREHLNVLICGPAEVGKKLDSMRARSQRLPQRTQRALRGRISAAQHAGRSRGRRGYPKLLESLAKTEALVMDD